MVSSGVQVEKSAFGINFLFIGVSSVTLQHNSKEQLSNSVMKTLSKTVLYILNS